jgi:hypothetical protein
MVARDRSKWRDWRKLREQRQAKRGASEPEAVEIVYMPVPPRRGGRGKRPDVIARIKRQEARKDERQHYKEEQARKKAERRAERAKELKQRYVEKNPRRAVIVPYEGPPATLDDLDELDVTGPNDVHLDIDILESLSEKDDGFIHEDEDEDEINLILQEELDAPPAYLTSPLSLNYKRANLFRILRRRFLLRRWQTGH